MHEESQAELTSCSSTNTTTAEYLLCTYHRLKDSELPVFLAKASLMVMKFFSDLDILHPAMVRWPVCRKYRTQWSFSKKACQKQTPQVSSTFPVNTGSGLGSVPPQTGPARCRDGGIAGRSPHRECPWTVPRWSRPWPSIRCASLVVPVATVGRSSQIIEPLLYTTVRTLCDTRAD